VAAREDLLGRLLAVPLDRFVEQRNRLSRELRESGDRDTASWLASLRRPSPAVWALDQMARGDSARMGALLDAGASVREVQSRAVQGDRDAAAALHAAGTALQRAVDDVVRRATALLRDAGHGAGTDTALSMAATLRAAATADDEVRDRLARGLLLAPVEEGGGFGEMDLDALPAPAVDASAQAAAVEAAAAAEREVEQCQAEVDQAEGALIALRQRLRAVQEELSAAEDRARAARAALQEAAQRARTLHNS